MVAALVILTIVVFVIVDVVTRLTLKRIETTRQQKAREKALDIGLRLDYTEEAPSLKRVEVKDARARILAVDDEPVVLDSFRKILVMAGYAIDTVESGKEAVGLVRKNDYDFVFSDLKMPEMDGLDVTKAVNHFRPDIDVVIITGYGTIETAVDAMKFGAVDYVQKPFTADELVEFTNQTLIRRQDRMERAHKPRLHLITRTVGPSTEKHTFNVPAGLFVAPSHTWVRIGADGVLTIGLDDFALKILGEPDGIAVPAIGGDVKRGDTLFSVQLHSRTVSFTSPVTGNVVAVNDRLADDPVGLIRSPYEQGWVCSVDPADLSAEIPSLLIGAGAVSWYEKEIDRYSALIRKLEADAATEEKERADEEPGAWREEIAGAFLEHSESSETTH